MKKWIENISGECVDCGICSEDCTFLRKYGTPLELADSFLRGEQREVAYHCSLCGLCKALCPKDLDPSLMVLAARKAVISEEGGRLRAHLPLRLYERLGTSPLFSWYGLPHGCSTVYFPGCSLPGRRSERVLDVYTTLRRKDPAMGLALDCCTKPSHDLGDRRALEVDFHSVVEGLQQQGVNTVLVNCPSCFNMFSRYGEGLSVRTVYQEFVEIFSGNSSGLDPETVTVHDPCSVREFEQIHQDVRTLVQRTGLKVEEMSHYGQTTLCCGEGGGIGFVDRPLREDWALRRKAEACGRKIITYCGGCTSLLEKVTPTYHLLDLLYAPVDTIQGRVHADRPPHTYLSRLHLKRRLPDVVQAPVIGRRTLKGKLSFSQVG